MGRKLKLNPARRTSRMERALARLRAAERRAEEAKAREETAIARIAELADVTVDEVRAEIARQQAAYPGHPFRMPLPWVERVYQQALVDDFRQERE